MNILNPLETQTSSRHLTFATHGRLVDKGRNLQQTSAASMAASLALAGLCVLALPVCAQEEPSGLVSLNPPVLLNGDFEQWDESDAERLKFFADRGLSLQLGINDLPGWRVEWGQPSLVGSYWPSSSGQKSLFLDWIGTGCVSQTFPTVPGSVYTVTFSLAAHPGDVADAADQLQPVKKLLVSTEDLRQAGCFLFDTGVKAASARDLKWEQRCFQFTATSASTTLYFSGLSDPQRGVLIDAVVARAVVAQEGELRLESGAPADFPVFGPSGEPTARFLTAAVSGNRTVRGLRSQSFSTIRDFEPVYLDIPRIGDLFVSPADSFDRSSGLLVVDENTPVRISMMLGLPSHRYQWLKDGVLLPGADGPVLNFEATSFSMGTYTARVLGADASSDSAPISLRIREKARPPSGEQNPSQNPSVSSQWSTLWKAEADLFPQRRSIARMQKGAYQAVLEGTSPTVDTETTGVRNNPLNDTFKTGRVTLNFNRVNAFSGQLEYGALKERFSGTLGVGRVFSRSFKTDSGASVTLELIPAESGQECLVRVVGGAFGETATSHAKLPLSGSAPAEAVAGQKINSLVFRTAKVAAQLTSPVGFLSMTVGGNGSLRVVGRLADGSPFTGTASIRSDGSASFYSKLEGGIEDGLGQICGSLNPLQVPKATEGGLLSFDLLDKASFGGPGQSGDAPVVRVTPLETSEHYIYKPSSSLAVVLKVSGSDPVDFHVQDFSGEAISPVRGWSSRLKLKTDSRLVEVVGAGNSGIWLNLNPASGVFSGKFRDRQSGVLRKLQGVLLEGHGAGQVVGEGGFGTWQLNVKGS